MDRNYAESIARKEPRAGDKDEAAQERSSLSTQNALDLDQVDDLDSDSDEESDYPDDGSESSHIDSDNEDDALNLFECANITLQGDAMVLQDICSTDECKMAFSSRNKCRYHIRHCPATMSQSVRVRADPVLPVTSADLDNCPNCSLQFLRATSLQLHLEACHGEQNRTCLHEDCRAVQNAFTPWALNLHHLEAHDEMTCHCPFPRCTFSPMSKDRQARRVSLIRHLNVRHALNLELKEVVGRASMTDQTFTYIDICADSRVPSSILPMPTPIVEDCQSVGARRDPPDEPTGIYEQLRTQAVFRGEEGIYGYNLSKLASLDYDDIRTPDEAARWLADERTSILRINREEIQFYDQLRARRGVFSTDVEAVGPLLVQAAIIDADRNVVVGGYIHRDCETVKEVWDLAVNVCGGPLTKIESDALRKAFGSPSMKRPRGYSMHWLVDQLKTLKKEYPDICMAEWSANPFDQVVYRNNIKRAGYDHEDILPPPENWVSPMGWFRQAGPSLLGLQLAYVACLYHSSSLVFRWHDAIADALMLMDILSTRQQKYHHGKVEVPPPAGLQKTTNGEDFLIQRPWFAREDRLCWAFMQDTLKKYEFASLPALCRAASYYLLEHKFFRTANSIKEHLTEKARRAQSEDEYVTCTDRQAQTLLLSTYNALTGPRSTSRRIVLEPKIDPAAKLLVQQAYKETPHEGRLKPLFWSQCQKQVHALSKSTGSTFNEQELDLALLVMINSRIHIVCKDCGAPKPGVNCHQCRIRKCVDCGGVARGFSRCSPCFYQYYKDKEKKGCMVCRRVCYGKICRSCEHQDSGCSADRVESSRRCASCFRKRRDQRKKSSQLWPPGNQGPIILNKGDCQDCGDERPAKGNATGACHSCQQRASRLEALEVNESTVYCQTRAEDGECTGGHEGVKELSESGNQRQTPGEYQFKEKTEVLGDCQEPQERGGAEQIESQDSAKVSDDRFPLLVANEGKRYRDDGNSDAANTYKKQKTLDESEQSPEHCIEGCGKLKKGRSPRCTDCGRLRRNKLTRTWSQKKRDEALATKKMRGRELHSTSRRPVRKMRRMS
ncbi:hypothetical protein CEK26_000168 [Fusarium fujikuroi]|nr:hypothetical protein CEK26_000168 [Fusarium fujikuroi]